MTNQTYKDSSDLPNTVYDDLGAMYRVVKPTVPDGDMWVQLEYIGQKVTSAQKHNPPKTWMGCRQCFGSGGKRHDPCPVCAGTGKVPKA